MDRSATRKHVATGSVESEREDFAYRLDATTADVLCKPAQWDVRDSFEAAFSDVCAACRRLDPAEFRLLMIDGVVTFRILEEAPGRGADIVWSWE
jgi:hypothetical protein